MKPIVVFGATGFTGRLVVSALAALAVPDLVIAGRSEHKLRALSQRYGGLPYRVADANDLDSVERMVRGAAVIISSAGPFITLGEPILRAALASGAHVLDTTGEQAYMARMLERYDAAARDRRLVVVNAQAFEFALGNCVGALLASEHPELRTLDVFNAVSHFGISRGTQRSGLAALGEPMLILKDGVLVEIAGPPAPKPIRFFSRRATSWTIPFPGGEALHLPKRFPRLRNVTTNLAVSKPLAAALTLAWPARKPIGRLHRRGLLRLVSKWIEARPEGPDEATRRLQRFEVLARGDEESAALSAVGSDAYGVTGTIAALAAKILIEAGPRDVGVISTDRAFGARDFLKELEPYGVRVVTSSESAVTGASVNAAEADRLP
jgi:short subunit dehydrogenase-like uncharacterized protein